MKHLLVSSKRVKITVWDTAGQERFRTLTSSYYRGAQGVILVYDSTRYSTFNNLSTWLNEVCVYSPNGGSGVVKLLVGNKTDLIGTPESETLNDGEIDDWAKENGMIHLKASAKDSVGVKECFIELVSQILQEPDLLAKTVPGLNNKLKIQPVAERAEAGGCC